MERKNRISRDILSTWEADREGLNEPPHNTATGAVNDVTSEHNGLLERAAYVEVNLDSLTHNIRVLRSHCKSPNTGVIAVVKAGAYGHGSVEVSKHLQSIGVERLAVATIHEGIHLRNHGITLPVHVFGNALPWEMSLCMDHNLIPTVSTGDSVAAMATALNQRCSACDRLVGEDNATEFQGSCGCGLSVRSGSINLKIDSGMSRNGCQPEAVNDLVRKCEDNSVSIDSMFTHFADSWDDPDFTQHQLDVFLDTVKPYRSRGILFHVANSGAILNGVGTDLDFIRPGISMYGLPPGTADQRFVSRSLKPLAAVRGIPTLVKSLPAGRHVGYGRTYTTREHQEWIGTFPVGYADGYWRHLSSKGWIRRDKAGEKCPVVGRVSMDAITVRLPELTDKDETFTLMSADYDPDTSASGIAETVGTIAYEVATRLSTRFPRVYTKGGRVKSVVSALESGVY